MMFDVDERRADRLLGLPHPDPHQPVAFANRITAHACQWRDASLGGRINAGALYIEGEAMVAALNRVAFESPHRQGQFAVGTGIFKGCDFARAGAVKHDGFVEQPDWLKRMANLARKSGHIPGVAQKAVHAEVGRAGVWTGVAAVFACCGGISG